MPRLAGRGGVVIGYQRIDARWEHPAGVRHNGAVISQPAANTPDGPAADGPLDDGGLGDGTRPGGAPSRGTSDDGGVPGRGAALRRALGRRPNPRALASGISLLVICTLLTAGMLAPVPYVIEQPGPAIDVLGEHEDQQILTISGHETYPTSGALMMTTVSVDGGPGYTVTPAEVVLAWFDPTRTVLPRELVFPAQQTRQETSLQNASAMTTSQEDAVAVALTELGIPVTPNAMVAGVLDDGPAAGVLKAGDVIVSIEGQTRASTEEYQQLIGSLPAGERIDMVVRRDGAEQSVSVPTEEVDGRTRMGIVLARGYDTPVDVTISLADVGGPSAGTMFSLAVYDELTPGELTGGQKIAGTGTMDPDGTVGPIGGIRQKLVGAREEGADYFLAPADNCDQVAGHVPEGLSVVKVSTFDEALHATETIASQKSADGLPTCSS